MAPKEDLNLPEGDQNEAKDAESSVEVFNKCFFATISYILLLFRLLNLQPPLKKSLQWLPR